MVKKIYEEPVRGYRSPTATASYGGVIDIWQEWTVPASYDYFDELLRQGDLSILAVSVVPDDSYRCGVRPKGTLEIRVADRVNFSAPIASLMDAHTSWKTYLDEVSKIHPSDRLMDNPTKLRVPILIGRKDMVKVQVDGTDKKYTLCVRMIQMQDVK